MKITMNSVQNIVYKGGAIMLFCALSLSLYHVSGWPSPSLVGCHAVNDKASGMPDVTSCTDHIHSWQNLIHILEHSKERSHGLTGWGHCFKLLFLWQCCDTIPCSVFFFYMKGMKPASVKHMECFFHWCLCSSVSKQETQGAQIFQYLKLSTTS